MAKPILKFKIKHGSNPEFFRGLLFQTRADMWAWYSDYHKEVYGEDLDWLTYPQFSAQTLSYEIFQDGEDKRSDEIGTVLFSKEAIGVGVISHEMTHCALWYDRLVNRNKGAAYGEACDRDEELQILFLRVCAYAALAYGEACDQDEERLAYLVGSFVVQTVNAFHNAKIYDKI